jgi:hypothetical protein
MKWFKGKKKPPINKAKNDLDGDLFGLNRRLLFSSLTITLEG